MTYYRVLGVPSGASRDDIHRAYLARARQVHPDVVADRSPAEIDHAAAQMRELNEAWAVLGDDKRRRDYDIRLSFDREAPPAPPPHAVPVDDAPDFGEDLGPASDLPEFDLRPTRPSDLALLI